MLLKNANGALPLAKGLGTIAVIGPNADDTDVLVGNYAGTPVAPVSVLAGIEAAAGSATKVVFARGGPIATGLPDLQVVPTMALSTPEREPGLRGEYFDGHFDGPAVFSRMDALVDFDWADGAPRARAHGRRGDDEGAHGRAGADRSREDAGAVGGRLRRLAHSGYDRAMERRLLGVVLFATLAGGCVLWPEGTGPSASPMPLDEALARRDRGEAVIVDVRSPGSFAAGHIPGAINIPSPEIPSRVAEIRRIDKLPILYCG